MDGYFDIIILGDGYKGNESSLFIQDAASAQKAILETSPFKERQTEIIFHVKNSKSSLGCDDHATGEGNIETIVCSFDKIKRAVKGIPMDRIIILANGKGHGSNQGQICTIGLGDHQPGPSCTFEQAAFYGKMLHELGHSFGLEHLNFPGNKMNSGTSGGCDIWRFGFLPEQQAIINNQIDIAIKDLT